MDNKKALRLLGLALSAGKLATGDDTTVRSIQNKQAKLVLIAKDASENTIKKIKDKCTYYQVPYVHEFTQAEITNALGRPRVVCAITDSGFAKKFRELIQS